MESSCSKKAKKTPQATPIGRRAVGFGLLALPIACTSGASPTLPIPPPVASASTPTPEGIVTVRGSGAIVGALVIVYNERTEEGVLGPARDDGTFELEISALSGDALTVWQQVGTDSSGLLSLVVP